MLCKIISVQQSQRNAFFNIPKEVRDLLDIKKGDKLLVKVEEGKIILEKC